MLAGKRLRGLPLRYLRSDSTDDNVPPSGTKSVHRKLASASYLKMISRLVTIDLVVTVITRVHGQILAEERIDPVDLLQPALDILNQWALKIESSGTAVSLDCILFNVLWLKTLPQYADSDILELGLQLITNAAQFNSLLELKRMAENPPSPLSETMEKALKSGRKLTLHQAAKVVTGLANSTEAANRFFEFLVWFQSRTPDSEKVKGFVTKIVSDFNRGEKAKASTITELFASELSRQYQLFKSMRPPRKTG
jgi:hypothetical protein